MRPPIWLMALNHLSHILIIPDFDSYAEIYKIYARTSIFAGIQVIFNFAVNSEQTLCNPIPVSPNLDSPQEVLIIIWITREDSNEKHQTALG